MPLRYFSSSWFSVDRPDTVVFIYVRRQRPSMTSLLGWDARGCPYYPAAINVICGSNKATKSRIRSRNDTPRVSIWSLYNIWLFFYFSCGWFSIGGPPKPRAVVTVLLRYNQRHLWPNKAIEHRILSGNVIPWQAFTHSTIIECLFIFPAGGSQSVAS